MDLKLIKNIYECKKILLKKKLFKISFNVSMQHIKKKKSLKAIYIFNKQNFIYSKFWKKFRNLDKKIRNL